jgi:hypothetical protein
VEAANAVGGKAELVLLPEVGIRGNSHMLMQDRNSLEGLSRDWGCESERVLSGPFSR